MRQEEIVFEILAEGGGLTIERIRTRNGEKFIYHHSETDFNDEGLDIDKKGEYKDFEKPFQLINSKYEWFRFSLAKVHDDFREYVLTELIKVLNKQDLPPDELRYSKQDLEKALNVELEFGNLPLKGRLQNIRIENLIKFTEYKHHEFKENYDAPSKESKFIPKAKFQTWLAGEQTFQHDQVKMSSNIVESFETVGILEVSGNTIIIKNENGQIEYAFSSSKFFVSTTPILSQSKGWVYKSI